MRFATTWIAAGFALALGTAPGLAADWGGIKDMGGGVPVPVPVPSPVPTYDYDSDWYVGVVLGGNVSQSATITDRDIGDFGGSTPGVFADDSSDIAIAPIFGLNFGRYITPSLRAEIAIDYSPNQQISKDGTLRYVVPVSAPNSGGGTDTMDYGIARNDTVKLSRTTGLVNLLYDIHTGTRFTPYVGGGLGFSWRKIQRDYSETSTCSQTADFPGLPASCPITTNPALPTAPPALSGSGTKEQIDLAAAVQAGIGYEINEWITWDNGWQMLWEGNAISSSTPSTSGQNKITYKDSVLQQFRSGIRVKFN